MFRCFIRDCMCLCVWHILNKATTTTTTTTYFSCQWKLRIRTHLIDATSQRYWVAKFCFIGTVHSTLTQNVKLKSRTFLGLQAPHIWYSRTALTQNSIFISTSTQVSNIRLSSTNTDNPMFRYDILQVKFSHIRYRALGPELIHVYRQSAHRWLFKSSPGGRLPLLSARPAVIFSAEGHH